MTGVMRIAAMVLVAAWAALLARPAAAVEVKEVVGETGVTAWLVEDHSNPIISVRFAWRGGAALDPEGKAGLANLVSGLLDEGAGDLDSKAFQRALDAHSVSLSFSAGKDSFSGKLTMLTAKADEAWNLLDLALSEPRFDAEPVARIRGQILAGLRQEEEDPNAIAGKTLMRALYEGHPYANPTDGTQTSVESLTRDDLRAFVRERLARSNLAIGVVGDITAEELAVVIDRVFGRLPADAVDGVVAEVETPSDGGLTVVRRNVPQSSILFAQPGPDRHHEDFYALYIMNHILGGGGFTSRLYKEVREKRGLAYSVYSYMAPYDRAAMIAGGAGTMNARVGETIDVIRAEWARMAEVGVSASELADAKKYMTGSYPLRFTSSGNIADMLVGLQLDDLGRDYFDIRNDLIEAVTLEHVNDAARRWLEPDSLSIVVVGDPDGIDDGG